MKAGSLIKTFFKHCSLTTKAETGRQLKLSSLHLLNLFNHDEKITFCHWTSHQDPNSLWPSEGLGEGEA